MILIPQETSMSVLTSFFQFGVIEPPPAIQRLGTGPEGLGRFIQIIIGLLIIVAGVASFIMLLVSGIQWVTSGGDQKMVAAARGRATAAIVGLMLTLAAFAIIRLIEYILGTNIISGGITLSGPP